MGRRLLFLLPVAGLVLSRAQESPAPPPRPPQPPVFRSADKIAEIEKKLKSTKPVDVTAQRALDYSRQFYRAAVEAQRADRPFQADRFAEAADALLHVAEHQQHLRAGAGPKGAPPAEAVRDHLQRVYFRVQQSEYFQRQSRDARAISLPKWARDFYGLASRQYEQRDFIAADENAKCAEEVVKALENLAQAAVPMPEPRPPQPAGPLR
jgi:hypothetical protein